MTEPEAFEVYLKDEGDEGTSFRTRNAKGSNFRRIIQQTPDGQTLHLTSKIRIEDIVHGTLSDGSHGALIILGFWFATNKQKYYFERVRLQFHFQDVKMPGINDPRVVALYPEGICYLYETVSSKAVTTKEGVSAGIQPAAPVPLNGNVEYSIETSENFEEKHGVLFTGMSRILKEYGDDEDAAEWVLEESKNRSDRRGVPAHLQTAVVLGIPSNKPFSMTLTVSCETDFQTTMKTKFFGQRVIEDIDPVQIHRGMQQLRVGKRPGDSLSVKDREALDLVPLDKFGFIRREMRVDATPN